MVANLARTSSMMTDGTLSNCLPNLARKSRARGWSQRITPVYRIH